jgi:hypothetical protein
LQTITKTACRRHSSFLNGPLGLLAYRYSATGEIIAVAYFPLITDPALALIEANSDERPWRHQDAGADAHHSILNPD